MPKYTPEEIELLKQYVTDPTGDVFCIKSLAGMVGAAYARYSRAKGGFRETLLNEFIKEGVIDPVHAEELIQRVLIAFGDDSVGELEGAHLSTENVSILCTKEMEECRIGGSPIEQSTRYVFYDHRNEKGEYRYYREPRIMESKHRQDYLKTMDYFFDKYCRLIEPMKSFYKKLKPLKNAEYDVQGAGKKQKYEELKNQKDQKAFKLTYSMDIRTRACDALRYILPIATLTNVGWFGNGRFYQSLLTNLYSSPFAEARNLAASAHRELNKIIPAYVKRAKLNEYQIQNDKNMYRLAEELTRDIEIMPGEEVGLLDAGLDYIAHKLGDGYLTLEKVRQTMQDRQDNLTIGLMLYAYIKHPLKQIINHIVPGLSVNNRQRVIAAYIGNRRTRRDRPYRAMESGYPYTFDLVTDFGVYKDLMRHRMTSQLRQRFSPKLGFIVPADIKEAGYEKDFKDCHDQSVDLYQKLYVDFPDEASYATLHGSRVRWLISFNEREAYHLLELRTTPQGHPAYRKIAQKMHKLIKEQSGWRADNMKYVDYKDYKWSRADSEAKQRVREKELERKIKNK